MFRRPSNFECRYRECVVKVYSVHPVPQFRLIGDTKVTLSRTTHPRSEEISIANLGELVLLRLPSFAIYGGISRKKKETLRSFVRALSFVIFLPPSRTDPFRRSPAEVLPAFNECHPGCSPGVYFYDASEIRLTRVGKGKNDGSRKTKTARSGDYDRRISSFMSVLSPRLKNSRALSFFFSHENSSTNLSSENDAKRTGRRGFGDPSSKIAACTRNVLRV